MPFDPLLNIPQVQPPNAVAGQLDVNGEYIVFAPDQELEPNVEYEITILGCVSSLEGQSLEEDITCRFAIGFSPMYIEESVIRQDIGRFIASVPSMDVAKIAHQVSLEADQLASQPYGSDISATTIFDKNTKTNKHYFREYVRWETALRLLLRVTSEHMLHRSEMTQVGDLVVRTSAPMGADLAIVTKQMEQRRDRSLRNLASGLSKTGGAVWAERGSPYPFSERTSF